jgi:diguanylate cyclase (GGDEF)-like protein
MSSLSSKNLSFEISLAILILLTLVAILGEEKILEKQFVIDNHSELVVETYDDAANGGNSSITRDETDSMRWSCNLRDNYVYSFCGFGIVLGDERAQGLDLSNYTKIRLHLDYKGPTQTVRVSLRNFDPLYSNEEDPNSTKFNTIEFKTSLLNRKIEFSLKDFFVANWWAQTYKIPPELNHPQFDNITLIEIQTGSSAALGEHDFRLHAIEFIGQTISTADWYLAIMTLWLILIVCFLVHRVVSLKKEVNAQRKQEMELIDINNLLDARSKTLDLKTKIDPLTGAFNRSAIEDSLSKGLMDWRKYRKPLSIVIIDIDHFKKINNDYGQDIGDLILSKLSHMVQKHIRAQDVFARWGGEEYLLICHETDLDHAKFIAEKLRELIANQALHSQVLMTASFGVATLKENQTLEQLFKAADVALYEAKTTGRNRVVAEKNF